MKSYLKYAFEIGAIVIGITLSFMVDEWREDNEQRQQLESNLKALKLELNKDIENTNNITQYYDSAAEIYMSLFDNSEELHFYSIQDMIRTWENLTDLGVKFQKNDNTYKALIKLNLFKHLQNDSILMDLNHYYTYWKVLLTDYEIRLKKNLEINREILIRDMHTDIGMLAMIGGNESEIKEALIVLNNDFEEIMANQVFRNNNMSQMMMYGYLKNLFNRYKEQTNTLILQIEKELEG